MKLILPFLFLFSLNVFSQDDVSLENNKRSDTLDVLNYTLFLDVTDFNNNVISGSCQVHFESKMNNVNGISLDLLALQIDSIYFQGSLANYTYNDTLIRVNFGAPLNQGDQESVIVFYHGTPQTDASGWGGFYFQSGIAYNLGVGFDANPHNFGRVWHPCFDNFVERATYTMTFKTNGNKKAYANGLIVQDSTNTNGEHFRTWHIVDGIPSYLAAFAVGDYTHITQTFESPIYNTTIPIMLVANASDTAGMANSFNELTEMIEIFEEHYGPFVWEKVGFVLVPFNAGAMEHATLIAYPEAFGAGNTNYGWLIAHELSHHWWGDLMTCKTASDMWINEGFAVFSEAIYRENAISYDNYLNDLKGKHLQVLQRAHFNDGGFFPLSGVPHGAVYGEHSYEKGSVMLHNMRTYLGDELFFQALHTLQQDFAHQAVDAAQVRDKITEATQVDMTDFFDDWIYQPGFVGVILDSFSVAPNGNNFDVQVAIRQKIREANHLFSSFPLQVTFVEDIGIETSETITFSGEQMTASFTLPFHPQMVYLNGNEGIMNAVTAKNYEYNGNGTQLDSYSYSRIIAPSTNPSDERLIRVEHCRVAPDPFIQNNPGIQISTERFWRIDGIWEQDFVFNGWFIFDGRNTGSGNLDPDLLINSMNVDFFEDSIRLLYRPNPSAPWQVWEDVELNTLGSDTDGYARVVANNLQKGEYTFGVKISSLSTPDLGAQTFVVFPNPAQKQVNIILPKESNEQTPLSIYSMNGTLLRREEVKDKEVIQIPDSWSGQFIFQLSDKNGLTASQLVILNP